MKELTVAELLSRREELVVGEKILLSGTIYTARDAAHKRMLALLREDKPLPFEMKDALIYYAGPTPPYKGRPAGACGPTTSGRMDVYAPTLYDMGLAATIGKGERGKDVVDAIRRNKALYLCAVGGAGALIAESIKKIEVIAFDDLGCESVKKMTVEKMPLTVAVDTRGNDIFARLTGGDPRAL